MAAQITKETTLISGLLEVAWFRRMTSHIPPEQFGRYLAVGLWNTLFGYGDHAALTYVLAPVVPHSYIPASIIAAPLNMTLAYLGYKWFVFKTRGNYLREWSRCLVVYGRTDIYEPGGVLLDYLHIVYPQSKTLFLLRKYHIDSCLMPADSALATMLGTLPDWKVAYRGSGSVLLVRVANLNAGTSTADIRKATAEQGVEK